MQFTGAKEKVVKSRKAALGAFCKKVCETPPPPPLGQQRLSKVG